jgi:imidazolonepropionase-like amidohydrolase
VADRRQRRSDTIQNADRTGKEKKGVDHIKIVNSGLNSLSCFAKETKPQFDSAELKAAVRADRQCGLKTMVHANGKMPVKIAVDAGCDSIEHGFFMGVENLHRIADRGQPGCRPPIP